MSANIIDAAWLERCGFTESPANAVARWFSRQFQDSDDLFVLLFHDGRNSVEFGSELVRNCTRPRLRALWFALTGTQLETGTPLDSDSPRAEEAAFWAAIADDPMDPDAQLVYADWLEDRGDPRAETVRQTAGRVRASVWQPDPTRFLSNEELAARHAQASYVPQLGPIHTNLS